MRKLPLKARMATTLMVSSTKSYRLFKTAAFQEEYEWD